MSGWANIYNTFTYVCFIIKSVQTFLGTKVFECAKILAETIDFRLPDNLKPTLYDFKIKPYISRNPAWPVEKDFTFEGQIDMHFTCSKPTDKIVFHAADMKIDVNSLTIYSSSENAINVSKSIEIDEKREFVIVTMNKQCAQGASYVLSMNYDGQVLPTLYGFYRSSYVNLNGDRIL